MSAVSYTVTAEGLDGIDLSGIDAKIERNARLAVNKAVRDVRTRAARRMEQQIAFPAGYLTGQNGRLQTRFAAANGPAEGSIIGRHRPTSLARFITGGATPNKAGVTVRVGASRTKKLARAFPIRLRAGSADLETKSNLGLAVRLPPGASLRNKKAMVQSLGNSGLYLLYAPSVSQVFFNVSEDVAPEALDIMEAEFDRLKTVDF